MGAPTGPRGRREVGNRGEGGGELAGCFAKRQDSCGATRRGKPRAATPKGHEPQAPVPGQERECDLGRGQEETGSNGPKSKLRSQCSGQDRDTRKGGNKERGDPQCHTTYWTCPSGWIASIVSSCLCSCGTQRGRGQPWGSGTSGWQQCRRLILIGVKLSVLILHPLARAILDPAGAPQLQVLLQRLAPRGAEGLGLTRL